MTEDDHGVPSQIEFLNMGTSEFPSMILGPLLPWLMKLQIWVRNVSGLTLLTALTETLVDWLRLVSP